MCDILRFPCSRRAVLDLYVNLILWQARGANQQPYALLHIGARRATHYAKLVATARRKHEKVTAASVQTHKYKQDPLAITSDRNDSVQLNRAVLPVVPLTARLIRT